MSKEISKDIFKLLGLTFVSGYVNENTTCVSECTEKVSISEVSKVENVIESNFEPLVNSKKDVGDDNKSQNPGGLRSSADETKTTLISVKESTIEQESNIPNIQEDILNQSQNLEAPCRNSVASKHFEENVDSNVIEVSNEHKSLNNVNNTAKAINKEKEISYSNSTNEANQSKSHVVTSTVCKIIGKSVAQEIVDEMIEKVVESSQRTEVHDKGINKTESEKDKKNEGKEKCKNEEKTFFSSKSRHSEDEDEVEKSDGSDSGIGSELIDEVITKSSDSSSTSSDEFPSSQGMGNSGEAWVTPCISFSEMHEDDYNGPPRLSMPTFDDLTRSPCDVFAMDSKEYGKERKEFSAMEETPKDNEGENYTIKHTISLDLYYY